MELEIRTKPVKNINLFGQTLSSYQLDGFYTCWLEHLFSNTELRNLTAFIQISFYLNSWGENDEIESLGRKKEVGPEGDGSMGAGLAV